LSLCLLSLAFAFLVPAALESLECAAAVPPCSGAGSPFRWRLRPSRQGGLQSSTLRFSDTAPIARLLAVFDCVAVALAEPSYELPVLREVSQLRVHSFQLATVSEPIPMPLVTRLKCVVGAVMPTALESRECTPAVPLPRRWPPFPCAKIAVLSVFSGGRGHTGKVACCHLPCVSETLLRLLLAVSDSVAAVYLDRASTCPCCATLRDCASRCSPMDTASEPVPALLVPLPQVCSRR